MQKPKTMPSDRPWGVFTVAWRVLPGGIEIKWAGEISPTSLMILRRQAIFVADGLVRRRVISRAEADSLRDGGGVIYAATPRRPRQPAESPKRRSPKRGRPEMAV
jgi:hypothetical protein